MELTTTKKTDVINILKDADGEDLENILFQIGMDNQLLKQLIMSATDLDLFNALEERKVFNIKTPLKP
jgi:hypothetical protein